MAVTQYIGARYVPVFADPAEWSSTKQYEPLTIVLHEGNSYTSRQFVPVGIDIDNTDYWVETGNYNAQVESYREEVQELAQRQYATPLVFSSVAEMKSSTLLQLGSVCITLSYHGSNTRGGGVYIIGNSGTPNERDVIACGSYIANLLYLTNDVSIDALGAYGDDTHDDTACIQFAQNKFDYRNLVFSDTTYRIDGPLTAKASNRMVGPAIIDCSRSTATVVITVVYSSPFDRKCREVAKDLTFRGNHNGSFPYYVTTEFMLNATLFKFETNQIKLTNIEASYFRKVFEYGNDAFIISTEHSWLHHNDTVITFDINSVSDSGEAIKFNDCIIGNNLKVIDNNEGMFLFTSCSIDYNKKIGTIVSRTSGYSNSSVTFIGCHIENKKTAGNLPYDEIQIDGSPNLYFLGCTFFLGTNTLVYSNAFSTVVIRGGLVRATGDNIHEYLINVPTRLVSVSGVTFINDSTAMRISPLSNKINANTYKEFLDSVTNGSVTKEGDTLVFVGGTYTSAVSESYKIPIEDVVSGMFIVGKIKANEAATSYNQTIEYYDGGDNRLQRISYPVSVTTDWTDFLVKSAIPVGTAYAKVILGSAYNGNRPTYIKDVYAGFLR